MTIYLHYKKIDDILDLYKNHEITKVYHSDKKLSLKQYCREKLLLVEPELNIEKNKYGKPIAKNSSLTFNQSHSQNFYLLAYSENLIDIGVDLEDVSRDVNMHALARRYFHIQEIERWKDTDFDSRFWFKVWTIKEAVLKAHGMGIRLQLSGLNTGAHPTWDFGCISHSLLGQFMYQSYQLSHSIMTIAYRCKRQDGIGLTDIVWI